jgi:hypothetical protein
LASPTINYEGAYKKRCTEQSRSVRDWVWISKATNQLDTYKTPPLIIKKSWTEKYLSNFF